MQIMLQVRSIGFCFFLQCSNFVEGKDHKMFAKLQLGGISCESHMMDLIK